MSDETKSLMAVCICLTLITSSVAWAISYHLTTVSTKAIEAGMEKSTLPGESGVHWVLPESK